MQAKRGHETNSFSALLVNTMYWTLSDFGQSFIAPLKWLFFLVVAFVIYFAILVVGSSPALTVLSTTEAIGFAILFSIKNAVPFFGGLLRFSTKPKGLSSWLDDTYEKFLTTYKIPLDWFFWPSIVQSFLDAILLFLFLLPLSNKFRLK